MRFIIILLLLFPAFSYSQKDTLLTYTDVMGIENVSKDQLFIRARAWLVDAFKSSKDVLQVQDKESGELIGKGVMINNIPYKSILGTSILPATTSFKISIWVKDNKYKYEITDLNNTDFKSAPQPFGLLYNTPTTNVKWPMISKEKVNQYYIKYREDVEATVKGLIASLNTSMMVKPKSDF